MTQIRRVLLVLAFVAFVLAAFGVQAAPWIPIGLALWVLSQVI